MLHATLITRCFLISCNKKKIRLKAAGRSGTCQGNWKRSWGYNQCLKQDFHLLKLLSEIKRKKKHTFDRNKKKKICVSFRTDHCLKKQFKHALCLCSVWTPIYHVTRITFWLLFLACAALQLGKVFFCCCWFLFCFVFNARQCNSYPRAARGSSQLLNHFVPFQGSSQAEWVVPVMGASGICCVQSLGKRRRAPLVHPGG